jgi:hypothetical protein
VPHTVPLLHGAVEHAILTARADARAASRGALPPHVGPPAPLGGLDAHEEDRAAAHTSAGSYAAAWGAAAMAAVLAAEEAESAELPAVGILEPRIARTAATEVARAFNDERDRIFDEVLDGGNEPGLYKVWSAVLDRRTCSFCFGMDGQVRALHESFGSPLPSHPNCRCFVELVDVPKPERLDDIAIDYESLKAEIADVIRERREVSGRHARGFIRKSMGPRRSPVALTEKFGRATYAER